MVARTPWGGPRGAQWLRRRDGPPSEAQTVDPVRSSVTPHSCARLRTIRRPRPDGAHTVRGAGRGVLSLPPSVTLKPAEQRPP